MARITAAFGSSHSVMLTCEVEDWISRFRDRDHVLPFYDKQGNPITYDDALARAPGNAAAYVTPAAIAQRYAETQAAMDQLRDRVTAARLDALVIVGDDQHELFHDDHMPSIGIYYGDTIANAAKPAVPEQDWYKRAQSRRLEPGHAVDYPCHGALALHLIHGLVEHGFDIAAVRYLREGQAEGHAYSFVHYRYLHEHVVPIVPIFLNTYHPPNQPLPRRCVAFGRALGALIAAFPEDMRVGLMASGGLSHFLVEEELDRGVLEAIKRKDLDHLVRLDPRRLQAGSSEIRSWVTVAAAATYLDLDWQAYIPGYRTLALSGTGLGFAAWT
jgi:Catalytic LigB subunit of aromatic ring-opening dioxygenase